MINLHLASVPLVKSQADMTPLQRAFLEAGISYAYTKQREAVFGKGGAAGGMSSGGSHKDKREEMKRRTAQRKRGG